MKLLVDSCAGVKLARALAASGHEVVFVGDRSEDLGDEEILASAQAQERIVITRDKDFGALAVRDRQPHCGIVRLVELPPARELSLCEEVLLRHEHALRRGALITAEPHRVRIREFQA